MFLTSEQEKGLLSPQNKVLMHGSKALKLVMNFIIVPSVPLVRKVLSNSENGKLWFKNTWWQVRRCLTIHSSWFPLEGKFEYSDYDISKFSFISDKVCFYFQTVVWSFWRMQCSTGPSYVEHLTFFIHKWLSQCSEFERRSYELKIYTCFCQQIFNTSFQYWSIINTFGKDTNKSRKIL